MGKSNIDAQRENIGSLVKHLRERAKLSQRDLSDLTGIRKATIVDIESGRSCQLNTLLIILDHLGGTLEITW